MWERVGGGGGIMSQQQLQYMHLYMYKHHFCLSYWVLGVLEIKEQTAILVLVLWVDVLIEIVQLLFNVVGYLFDGLLVHV